MNWLLKIWKWIGRWPWAQQWLLWLMVPKFLIGVVAVVLDGAGNVVLFHHTYRRKYPWSLPGGWLKRGEEPIDALRREIHEESRLQVEIIRPLAALSLPVAPNFEVVYLARLIGGEFTPSAEVDRMEAFSLDRLPELKPYQRGLIEKIMNDKM